MPPAESTLSIFTANNLGSKISTDRKYYVVGTIVKIEDAYNGIFWIEDEAGDQFFFRLPVNSDGVAYSKWSFNLLVGDKVKLYGKIGKFTTQSAPGGYYPTIASALLEIVELHDHDFTFAPATCTKPAFCECEVSSGDPLGHKDDDADKLCDACGFRTDAIVEVLATRYNDIKGTEADQTANGSLTFAGTAFTVMLEKGSSRLNTSHTDHIRVQNNNVLTISAGEGKSIISITFTAISVNYVDECEAFLTAAGYEYTVNDLELTVEINSLNSVVITNTASKVVRLTSISVAYLNA